MSRTELFHFGSMENEETLWNHGRFYQKCIIFTTKGSYFFSLFVSKDISFIMNNPKETPPFLKRKSKQLQKTSNNNISHKNTSVV